MRLRQLARKLQVQPKQLIGILSKNGHEIENDPNFKLTEEQENLILSIVPVPEAPIESKVVTPKKEAVKVVEAIEEPLEVVEEVEIPTEEVLTPEVVEEAPKAKPKTKAPEEAPKVYSLEKEAQEKHKDVELIKAPKLELEGLKILGKIDLPEPKVKEKTKPVEAEETTEKPQTRKATQNRSNPTHDRKRENQRTRPTALELERRKAEKEARQKKLAEEKRIKALKEKHYKENVQAKLKATAAKKKKQKSETNQAIEQPKKATKVPVKKQAPKKGLRRLWAWLNGKLDKY
ncbi:hypothetical protein [Roseivirga sp.]|uniref:hypothetical protein n=1 Tax=Roseivirga sp. TaxID=1964215 RepID=UPI002B26CF4B|nr:hypothetical protein [Roseivirga sp.]